jgi:hypothetical protein
VTVEDAAPASLLEFPVGPVLAVPDPLERACILAALGLVLLRGLRHPASGGGAG